MAAVNSSHRRTAERFGEGLTLLAAVCLAGVALAAQETSRQSGEVLRLFVTATDRQGHVVSDLAADDFVVLDNDKPQTPTIAQDDIQPITAILLIDTSASMTGTYEPLAAAVDQFIGRLRPQDRVRAGTFNDKLRLTSRFTASREEVKQGLQQPDFGNGTRLHDALLVSFDQLADQPGLHVVIAITDGEDTDSLAPLSKVLEREHMDDAIVYVIGLQTQYFNGQRMVRNTPGPSLKQLAEETGGSFFAAPRIGDVPALLTRIGQELQGHYLLGFSPQQRDGREHKLTVRAKRPGITVHSRRRYIVRGSTP